MVNQINRRTIIVMAVVVGLGVANLFYCQPLLAQIGTSLGIGARSGYIPTFTLGGVMLSMFAVVPLGDMTERRRLIVAVSIASSCAAALTAISPNFVWVALANGLLERLLDNVRRCRSSSLWLARKPIGKFAYIRGTDGLD